MAVLTIIGIVLALTTFAAITKPITVPSSDAEHAQTDYAGPILAYNYMIYIDPTTSYYEAVAANGTICWSSTNAASVIQRAVNVITTTGSGGTLAFASGKFVMTSGINITYGAWQSINIEGSGEGTFFLTNSLSNQPCFAFEGAYSGEKSISISNLMIQSTGGISANSTGISIEGNAAYSLKISNVFIWYVATGIQVTGQACIISMYGLSISYCTIGIDLQTTYAGGASQIWIYSPTITHCVTGILFTGATSSFPRSEDVIVTGGMISYNEYGVLIPDGTICGAVQTFEVNGVYFEANTYGLYLDGNATNGAQSEAINIQSCFFTNQNPYDIYLGNIFGTIKIDSSTFEWSTQTWNIYDAGSSTLQSIILENDRFQNIAGAINSYSRVYAPAGTNSQFSANGSNTAIITAAQNVTVGQVLYRSGSGYYLADALTSATLPVYGVYGLVIQTFANGQCVVLTFGQFTDNSWNWTTGSPLYVSDSTAGNMQQSAPNGTQSQAEIVAQALSPTTILFDPKSVFGH